MRVLLCLLRVSLCVPQALLFRLAHTLFLSVSCRHTLWPYSVHRRKTVTPWLAQPPPLLSLHTHNPPHRPRSSACQPLSRLQVSVFHTLCVFCHVEGNWTPVGGWKHAFKDHSQFACYSFHKCLIVMPFQVTKPLQKRSDCSKMKLNVMSLTYVTFVLFKITNISSVILDIYIYVQVLVI